MTVKEKSFCWNHRMRFQKGLLCASPKSAEQSTFSGDSGGPLFYINFLNKFVQIGIHSHRLNEKHTIGGSIALTSVKYYLSWIKQKIGKLGTKLKTAD